MGLTDAVTLGYNCALRASGSVVCWSPDMAGGYATTSVELP
jgi:hypothetical protein